MLQPEVELHENQPEVTVVLNVTSVPVNVLVQVAPVESSVGNSQGKAE